MKYKPVKWEANGCTWYKETTYVDIETGEIITKKLAKDINKYIIIKIIKNGIKKTSLTGRTIEYTAQCRKQPQTKLDFNR